MKKRDRDILISLPQWLGCLVNIYPKNKKLSFWVILSDAFYSDKFGKNQLLGFTIHSTNLTHKVYELPEV